MPTESDGSSRGNGAEQGRWREILGRRHRRVVAVLAGGVGLYATNVFLTTSLLPAAVEEIGGDRFYAWVTTVFLLASVLSSTLVSAVLPRLGARNAYFAALGLFALGTATGAAAPGMEILLAGRFVQGLGGGLLCGLGYALIRSVLPERLWALGTALVSGMWGVGTFLGPAAGGAFAQVGMWRGALVALLVVTLLLAVLVPQGVDGTRTGDVPPSVSPLTIALLTLSVLLVSLGNLVGSTLVLVALLVAATLGLALAFAWDRRRGGQVLPRSAFSRSSPLPWCYAALALLSVASQMEAFIPLFGQRLAGLAPLLAGFAGAAIALGWTLGEIPSAGVARAHTKSLVTSGAPLLVTAGYLTAGLLVAGTMESGATLVWVVALLVGGAGIGTAWPHLTTRVMGGVAAEHEGETAAAAINTVQLVSNAVGSAVVGVLVHLGGPAPQGQARAALCGIALTGLLGAWCAWRGTAAWRNRGGARPSPRPFSGTVQPVPCTTERADGAAP
ncbi:MFS transporter [Streptomyces tubbatahanensis]|uniref:MFS transporter n=1 Tax=Streptomyces tubbatahanensis TaxID=2923272 RepID=A0ABY3XTI2_9ACTN|nr:MFS transporter [Streptomyces tubbatahanensis]UNS97725.1 MFS transporter [Streptomyces tubbatahanensis]